VFCYQCLAKKSFSILDSKKMSIMDECSQT
jgi:hypothetical protein